MTPVEEKIVYVAGKVRERFLRKDAPANPDDVFQDAALVMLEALRKGRLDVDQNVSGYFWRIGVTQAGVASSKMLSKVSIPAKKAHLARKFQRGVPIQGIGATEDDIEKGNVAVLVELGRPSDRLAAARRERARQTLTIRQARIMESHALALDDLDRKIVTKVFGLGGDAPPDGGVEEAAFCLGITAARARNAVARYGTILCADEELRRVRRNMSADASG